MPLILLIAIISLSSIVLIAVAGYVRHKKGSGSSFVLVGNRGRVEAALTPEGAVVVDGEVWRARLREGAYLARGRVVRVCGVQGILLIVEPLE